LRSHRRNDRTDRNTAATFSLNATNTESFSNHESVPPLIIWETPENLSDVTVVARWRIARMPD
jgi:hypothetical protein